MSLHENDTQQLLLKLNPLRKKNDNSPGPSPRPGYRTAAAMITVCAPAAARACVTHQYNNTRHSHARTHAITPGTGRSASWCRGEWGEGQMMTAAAAKEYVLSASCGRGGGKPRRRRVDGRFPIVSGFVVFAVRFDVLRRVALVLLHCCRSGTQ